MILKFSTDSTGNLKNSKTETATWFKPENYFQLGILNSLFGFFSTRFQNLSNQWIVIIPEKALPIGEI